MQQLKLQFEGYADTQQHIDVGATRQRRAQADSPLVHVLTAVQQACTTSTKALYRQYKGSVPAVQKACTTCTALRYRIPFSPLQFLQAALLCAFGFVMFFFAAIIGG